MLELRKMNLQDIKEQWEYVTALPKDENGLTNPYEGITFEEYETTVSWQEKLFRKMRYI